MVINGRSWPNTERLAYKVGDTVRMRLINAGGAVHPMHLHGFYFKVDSRGDERADTIFAKESSPRMAVTERLAPGRTFTLTWKPTRPGNWLFHCHDNAHLEKGVSLDASTSVNGGGAQPAHQHVENHALEMMSGPVMGISLRVHAPFELAHRRATAAVPAGPNDPAEAGRAGQHHRQE